MSSNFDERTPALSMYLSTYFPTAPTSWQPIFDRAVAADRAGVDRLSVSDHVVFGENLEAYGRADTGGREGGKQPTGPDGHWLEPLSVLTTIAALTRDVRLQTGILIAALRRPVVLAKTAATLDVLSNGRLDLGVGIGWQREEYDAAGLSYERRGRLLDHTLAVLQTLWRESPAAYSDALVQFDRIHQMPKPRQPGGVPIWVSGTLNDRVIERIVRFGAGWIPWGPDAADLEPALRRVHAALETAGRSTADFQVCGALPHALDANGKFDLGRSMESVPALVEAGVTDFRISAPIPDDADEAFDMLSETVSAFRATVGRPLP